VEKTVSHLMNRSVKVPTPVGLPLDEMVSELVKQIKVLRRSQEFVDIEYAYQQFDYVETWRSREERGFGNVDLKA